MAKSSEPDKEFISQEFLSELTTEDFIKGILVFNELIHKISESERVSAISKLEATNLTEKMSDRVNAIMVDHKDVADSFDPLPILVTMTQIW